MSNSLEPMKVEFSDILVWMKESILIFRRRPIVFLAISLAFFFVCYKVRITNYLTFFIALLLCLLALVICIVVARGADESKKLTLTIWYQSLVNAVTTMVFCSAFCVLLWVMAERVASMLMLDEVVTESSLPPPVEWLLWLNDGTISLYIIYLGIMITTMWFLLPLSVFHRLGFIDSVMFAKQGERKNFPVIAAASYLPFMVFFVLFLFSDLALVVAVAALPLFAIYMYVSFRHVYMGRKESLPEKVKSIVALPAESG